MITCIREVRRAKRLTLQDVADRCDPPTTAQTIGRLETGTRTVSVGWLNRIAAALGVEAADLVRLPETADLPVAALLDADGAHAPRSPRTALAPRPEAGAIAIAVAGSIGGLSRRRCRLVPTDRARSVRRGDQPRCAAPPPRRPLRIRPPDRSRRRQAPHPRARRRQPAAGDHRRALGRDRNPAGA